VTETVTYSCSRPVLINSNVCGIGGYRGEIMPRSIGADCLAFAVSHRVGYQ
jgi:hypothetical protein